MKFEITTGHAWGAVPSSPLAAAVVAARPFDLLVVGGGATGCGIAVDAATRGLSVALVEREDIAAGTSHRSTKLLHGGVRYLEKAVFGCDAEQLRLVHDGLAERGVSLRLAPHLAGVLDLVTPVASAREMPYILAGLHLYDRLSGHRRLGASRHVPRADALRAWPRLALAACAGAVVYRDGTFDDARFALALARTAGRHGALVSTGVAVVSLIQERGRIAGALVREAATGTEAEVRARVVINATGPQADVLRRLDGSSSAPLLAPSAGIHLSLDRRLWPHRHGLLIPKTRDGRVMFLLPWQGGLLAGTTDDPADPAVAPAAGEAQIAAVLGELAQVLRTPPRRNDVRAAWSGLRPLLAAPADGGTQALLRDHRIEVSPRGLLTVAGGKWTTWRLMARDAVDAAIRIGDLSPRRPCRTHRLALPGAAGWRADVLPPALARFDADVAHHLHYHYGSEAEAVLAACDGERLLPGWPYLAGEIDWAIRHGDSSGRSRHPVVQSLRCFG